MQKLKAKTNKELQRKIIELEAQLVHRYHYAEKELKGAGEALMASAAIVAITALGGREILAPVAIRDGLSAETIAALKKDIQRSYAIATLFKPAA